MNADALLAHYARIADAPDAIARLRRFVLELAVRGKLVEQDAADEPASELLKRIAAEKSRLVAARKIKKSEIEAIQEGDTVFSVPANWAWARLGDVGDWGAGSTPSRGDPDLYGEGITWLKSGELNDNTHLSGSEETVTELAVKKGSFRLNAPGDVLIAMYGATIGKLAILAEHAVTNQAVCGCTPFNGVLNRYLFLFLLSQREAFHSASEGGAQPNISKVKIVRTPFPLPPLAEQHRIVAKVDELMALCDRLEAARTEREAARDRLAAASLARLNAPDPDPATFTTHARFALNNLAPLTTRPDQIKHLRQTILNLAVRGKLVAQDAADEPAKELLEKVANQNSKRVASGQSKAMRGNTAADFSRYPFDIPNIWHWTTLDKLAFKITDGTHHTPNYTDSGVPFLSVKDMSSGKLDFTNTRFISNDQHAALSKRCDPELGDLLITKVGTTGVPVIVDTDRPFSLFVSVALVKAPWDLLSVQFLRLLVDSPFVRAQSAEGTQGIGNKNLVLRTIGAFCVPIPPLAEQHRIVAKVDELMALCDRLEASLATADETRRRLLEALLHEALAPNEARALEPA